uniref:rho GTPase-activating protein 44-like n=1 Tax=Oncorhynchus gorbuscha TaxID=8017 RepID=UPI001EAED685|nr:rho GTPase-activating protein 44-like [Oncorhynchus gorbuscha]
MEQLWDTGEFHESWDYKPHGTLRSKESSPVIGHKGVQVAGPTAPPGVGQQSCSQSPHSTEHSPHTMRKGSKKPAPIPPKVPAGYGQSGGSGGISDQSTGQPSPVSLSPTPPSTPSPYGLAGPPQAPGGLGASSPGQTPLCGSLGSLGSLSSPPSLTGTLGKSRPTPKPRQRPSLPPPQPPTVPQPGATPVGPGPLEQGILDGLSPGESMSTDYFNYEIPSINVNLDSLIDEFSGAAPCRRYGAVTHSPPPRRDDNPDHDPYAEDDEPQDTTL